MHRRGVRMLADRVDLYEKGRWAWGQGLVILAAECWRRLRDEARRVGHRVDLMRSLNALGCVEYELGRFHVAQAVWKRAEALVEAEPSCDPRFRVKVLVNLALGACQMGRFDEADAYVRAARDGCQDLEPSWRVHVEHAASAMWITVRRWDEAEKSTRQALELLAGHDGDPRVAHLQTNLGQICLERGDLAGASAYLEAAREVLERCQGDHPNLGSTYGALAWLHYLLGSLDRAVFYGSEALRVLWPNVLTTHKPEVAVVSELFGSIALDIGDRQTALLDLQRASTYFAQAYRWTDWARVNQLLDDLVRQWNSVAGRVDSAAAIHPELRERLCYFTTLLDLLDSIESLYPDIRQQAELTCRYALALGRALQLSPDDLEALGHAAKLHDIGITSLDPEVVRQRDPVGPVARDRMRAHPLFGEKILSLFPLPELSRDAVRHHHERYDGSGFPDGLAGEDIPLLARIIAVAATYVSVGLKRGHTAAMLELSCRRGRHLDPGLVDLFASIHDPVETPVAAAG